MSDHRSEAVLEAMATRPHPLTASQLAEMMSGRTYGYLWPAFGVQDRVFDALKRLERRGRVVRLSGRPARWSRVVPASATTQETRDG